ncbi:MAG: hypothetical protein VX531_04755 [Bacteroidota bacterium]|nr:hypothetical protein [Bacteroidota bacterium]
MKMKLSFFIGALLMVISSCNSEKNAKKENLKKSEFIYAKDGRLYFPDGKELALWGVNLQPCLSWEYNSLFKLVGTPLDADSLKTSTDNALVEIEKMNMDLIRVHLTPTDFTDNQGNLVETIYLDMLDYMVAQAAKKNIYSYITFLNPGMSYDIDVEDPKANIPSYVENSFLDGIDRKEIIVNKDVVFKSKNFIKQLLNRVNPYLNKQYKDTEQIALWEIVNEPVYFSYDKLKETKYYSDFKHWIDKRQLEDTKENYSKYRYDLVYSYINTMYDVVRETGAVQPIVWNCNWNRMIKNNNDVFDAIGASKVEVVSFCNYPGQSVLKKPYTKNPEDLTRYDFASFFEKSYKENDWYGWVFRNDFMKKAKVVYEFETFYNQSKYLYPAQVDFFRAMGVQTASMWHYSMPRYAPYRNGSHHLSLTSTPGKAAAYTVAGALFKSLPLYHKYDTTSPTEKLTNNYMYSYSKDLSAYSSKEIYVHAGDMIGDKILKPKKGVKKIIGFGNSSLVSYGGNGMYSLDISEEQLNIEIQPNIEQLKPLWGKDFLVSLVTKLDYDSQRVMTLNIEGWSKENSELLQIVNNKKVKAAFLNEKDLSFNAVPGTYLIRKSVD